MALVGEAYHEWSGPMLADIVDRVLARSLVGERAERREWLWHRSGSSTGRRSWYLALRRSRRGALGPRGQGARGPGAPPIGTYRGRNPAYASTTGTFLAVEGTSDVADQCLELGPTTALPSSTTWGNAKVLGIAIATVVALPRRGRRRAASRASARATPNPRQFHWAVVPGRAGVRHRQSNGS